MKRKNLFLSLICSLILTIALVTVTVLSVLPKKDSDAGKGTPSTNVSDTGNTGDNTQTKPDVTVNEDRDGSAEKPYVVYDAETFETFVVGKYLDENGKYIDYSATADDGSLLYPELSAGLYYELGADIDFAGTEFKTLFNQGIAFNGHIDGKGFALKNISINVTKDNLVSDYVYTKNEQMIANVGVFGELYNAEIKDVKFVGLEVVCEDGLYEYIWSAGFGDSTLRALSVGSIAGVAYESKISADVEAVVDGLAYGVYSDNRVEGECALGGIAGLTVDCEIVDTTVDVQISADEGVTYYVGGVVGAAFDTKMTNVKVDADVQTYAKQALSVAGVVGYARAIEIDTADVKLAVAGLDENRLDTDAVTQIDSSKYASVAGVVVKVVAKEDAEVSKIANVKVVSDANIDATMAGVVVEASISDELADQTAKYFEFKDIIADTNAYVLKAFGFAKYVENAKIDLAAVKTELIDGVEVDFNIRLTGKASLKKNDSANVIPVEIFMTANLGANYEVVGGKASIKVVASLDMALSAKNVRGFGSFVTVE